MKGNTKFWAMVAIVSLFALAFPGTGAGAPQVSQQAKKLDKIVVGVPVKSFGFLPLWVGIAKGFFKEEGIDQEIVLVASKEGIAGMMHGDIHISASATSVMRAAAQGMPLKCIMWYYTAATWEFTAGKQVQSIKDLKGKTIGVQTLNNEEHFASRMVLSSEGLDPEKNVKFVAVGAGNQKVAALESGAVDATIINVDEAARLKVKGFKVLLSTAKLMPTPFSGLATTDKLIKENPDLLKRWLRAQIKSMIFTRDKPKETAAIAARELNMDPKIAEEAVLLAIEAIDKGVPGGASDDAIKRLIKVDIAGALKLKEEDVPAGKIIDLSLWKEVAKEFKK